MAVTVSNQRVYLQDINQDGVFDLYGGDRVYNQDGHVLSVSQAIELDPGLAQSFKISENNQFAKGFLDQPLFLAQNKAVKTQQSFKGPLAGLVAIGFLAAGAWFFTKDDDDVSPEAEDGLLLWDIEFPRAMISGSGDDDDAPDELEEIDYEEAIETVESLQEAHDEVDAAGLVEKVESLLRPSFEGRDEERVVFDDDFEGQEAVLNAFSRFLDKLDVELPDNIWPDEPVWTDLPRLLESLTSHYQNLIDEQIAGLESSYRDAQEAGDVVTMKSIAADAVHYQYRLGNDQDEQEWSARLSRLAPPPSEENINYKGAVELAKKLLFEVGFLENLRHLIGMLQREIDALRSGEEKVYTAKVEAMQDEILDVFSELVKRTDAVERGELHETLIWNELPKIADFFMDKYVPWFIESSIKGYEEYYAEAQSRNATDEMADLAYDAYQFLNGLDRKEEAEVWLGRYGQAQAAGTKPEDSDEEDLRLRKILYAAVEAGRFEEAGDAAMQAGERFVGHDAFLAGSHFEDAVKNYKKTKAEEKLQIALRAAANSRIPSALEELGEHAKAADRYLEIAKKVVGDGFEEASSFYTGAVRNYFKAENYQKALEVFEEALASTDLAQGWWECIEMIEQAIASAWMLGQEDLASRFRFLLNLARNDRGGLNRFTWAEYVENYSSEELVSAKIDELLSLVDSLKDQELLDCLYSLDMFFRMSNRYGGEEHVLHLNMESQLLRTIGEKGSERLEEVIDRLGTIALLGRRK